MHQKLFKLPRKAYAVGFPFNKFVRLQSVICYHIKFSKAETFRKCCERKGCFKISKIPKNFSKTVPFSSTLQSRISGFNKKRLQEKVFEDFWSHFIRVSGLQSRIYTLLKKSVYTFFWGCLEKTAVLKVSGNFQKNVFFEVPFNQFELSNLPPIAILETDTATNISWDWLKFLGRPVNTLQKESTVDVLLKGYQNFLGQLVFWKH